MRGNLLLKCHQEETSGEACLQLPASGHNPTLNPSTIRLRLQGGQRKAEIRSQNHPSAGESRGLASEPSSKGLKASVRGRIKSRPRGFGTQEYGGSAPPLPGKAPNSGAESEASDRAPGETGSARRRQIPTRSPWKTAKVGKSALIQLLQSHHITPVVSRFAVTGAICCHNFLLPKRNEGIPAAHRYRVLLLQYRAHPCEELVSRRGLICQWQKQRSKMTKR